ncbi:T9SS type A sorting domain-containing protein [Corallibacter sp.]|uniref:T9SS type A sorting domain-containing protein n=1 Tax=Corallibacter sp. TaxID=2038084 RepID=UPI003AB1A235
MKKAYIFIAAVFLLNTAFSQDLYINNNSYLYAKDVPLFVNNDIRMETTTSNLYLRGSAQLIQNNDVKNSDIGSLSIYQQQTEGVYEYNYWASPVGVGIDGTAKANVPFNGSNIFDPQDETDIENVNATPYAFTNSYNATPSALASYWLFTMESGGGYADWVQIRNTGNAGTGYGFSLKGSPNVNNTLDFRGRPNTGDITVNCYFSGTDSDPQSGSSNQVETLTGNPYPSALDLKLFFVNNVDNQNRLDGNIYFWEQKQVNSHTLLDYEGGYAVYTPGDLNDLYDDGTYTVATFESYDNHGGNPTPTAGTSPDYALNHSRRYAAVGQGFVISSADNGGAPAGGVITFSNSMRLYLPEDSTTNGSGAIFGRSSENTNSNEQTVAMSHNGLDYMDILNNTTIIPEIRIHTRINNTYYKESVIAFRQNADLNYNKFSDAKNASVLPNDNYLMAGSNELSIKSINYSPDARIPFGFESQGQNTTYSVTVNSLKDVPEDVNVYVFDKTTGVYTNIKTGTFEVSLPTGTYNNRFEITFDSQTLSTNDDVTALNDFKILQNNNDSQLVLINPKQLAVKSVTLFDISGKRVLNELDLDTKDRYSFSTKNLSEGVYIAKVLFESNQETTKKVIISNKK